MARAVLQLVEVSVAKRRKRAARVPGRHLGTIEVLGVPVPVVVTTPAEVDDEKILTDAEHASFDVEANVIRLHEASSGEVAARNHHLCHELIHGWMGLSGARYYLRTLLRMTSAEFEAVEENLVRHLTPALSSSAPGLARVMAKPVE